MQVYGSRRGADYSFDQLSRFLDRGVRGTMQRVVVEEPGDAPAPAVASPEIDLRALCGDVSTPNSQEVESRDEAAWWC